MEATTERLGNKRSAPGVSATTSLNDSDSRSHSASSSIPIITFSIDERNRVSCAFCRKRHMSCRGAPVCYNCKDRNIECLFQEYSKRGPKPKRLASEKQNNATSTLLPNSSVNNSREESQSHVNRDETAHIASESVFDNSSQLSLNIMPFDSMRSPLAEILRPDLASPAWDSLFSEPFLESTSQLTTDSICPIPYITSILDSNPAPLQPKSSQPETKSIEISQYCKFMDEAVTMFTNEFGGLSLDIPSMDYLLPLSAVTEEGKIKQLILYGMLASGASSLHCSESARVLHEQTLDCADIYRPWRTQYFQKRNRNQTPRTHQGATSLEEEMKELKLDENLCVGFMFALMSAHLQGGTEIFNELIAAIFEVTEHLATNWLRVAKTYNTEMPLTVRNLLIYAFGFCWLWLPEENREQYQDLLLDGVTGKVIPYNTPANVLSDVEIRLLLLSWNLMDEVFDIFSSLWSFYNCPFNQQSTPKSPAPPSSTLEYSYQRPTMEIVVIEGSLDEYDPPTEVRSTYIDPGLVEPNCIVTKERAKKLGMFLFEQEDIIAQIELDPTVNTQKAKMWRGGVDVIQSAVLWLSGKKSASFLKFQAALTRLHVLSSNDLFFAQISVIFLKLVARLHNTQLNINFAKCHPGLLQVYDQLSEGIPPRLWVSTKSFSLQPNVLTQREMKLLFSNVIP